MNRTVTATGMKVKAQADKSLVIADYTTTAGATTKVGVGTDTVVTFTGDAVVLLPATHYVQGNTYPKSATSGDNLTTVTTGLTYVTNGIDVNASTGYAQATKTLYYADAVNSETSKYYVDYKVCIASSGGELTGQTLTAQIITPDSSTISTLTKPTLKATSIDFYYSSDASIGIYAGTLNVAGLDYSANDGTAKTQLDLFNSNTAGGTIPANRSTTTYLTITMRIYVDGNLKQPSSTNAFVNSDQVDLNELTLGVSFTANTKTGG